MKKRIYLKSNHKYWNMKKINKHSMKIWKTLLILMGLVLLYALIARYVNRMPLISPEFIGPVQVEAKEPEVFISCDNPRGYLECLAYQKKINWEQHDKISKIIACESNWNPNAINTKNSNGTWDAGLVQINSIHKDISNADKFDFKKSIDWMIKKINKDGGYGAWSCAYKLNIK